MKIFLRLLLIAVLLGSYQTVYADDSEFSQMSLKSDRRSPEAIANDQDIEVSALSNIQDEDELHGQSRVHVSSYNGLVLVYGEATTAEVKEKILNIVRVIEHVKVVRDNLAVKPLGDNKSHIDDRQLNEQIKAALAQIRTLPDFSSKMIKVITDNGVVYLMGLLSKEEGSTVVNVTRLQPGVKQIVAVFEYLD
jgi:osmotically-inducible protein OsmY